MRNRSASATSPYLLQHADNPVDLWEWSPEAFAEARRRNVPILLSVGYAGNLREHLQSTASFAPGTIDLDAAVQSLAKDFDATHGGFGGAPTRPL